VQKRNLTIMKVKISIMGKGDDSKFLLPLHTVEVLSSLDLSCADRRFPEILSHRFPALKQISLGSEHVYSYLTNASLSGLAGGSPKLEELTCMGCDFDDGCGFGLWKCSGLQQIQLLECRTIDDLNLTLLAQHCRHIKVLRLSGNSRITSASVALVLQSCSMLVDLSLISCTFDLQLRDDALPLALETLEISDMPMSDLSLQRFLSYSPSLRSLNITDILSLTDALMPAIASLLSLQSLTIENCPRITLHGLCPIIRVCDLKMLHLHAFCIVPDVVTLIADTCTSLVELSITWCKLSDPLVLEIARCKLLEKVDFTGCQLITASSLHSLMRSCSLTHLSIPYCAKVTVNDIKAFEMLYPNVEISCLPFNRCH